MDLQEMFDIMEADHKKFKNENVGRNKDLEGKIDDVSRENCALKERNAELEKKCEELQVFYDFDMITFSSFLYSGKV